MKKIISLISILLFISAFLLSAEEETEPAKALDAANGVGVSYFTPDFGSNSDMFLGGICYQHWFTPDFALEAGGAVSWDPGSSYKPLSYDVYCEGDFVLFKSEVSRFFASRLYAWGTLGHTGKMASNYDSEKMAYKDPVYFPNFHAGAGFGFDLIFFRHVSLPLKFGFSGSLTGAGFTFGGGIKYIW